MQFDTQTVSPLPAGTIEQGAGEPILLLHGVLGTPRMWSEVLPLLAAAHRVIALPALGHLGGRSCQQRPARIEQVVDDAERSLDALGLDRAHLAGNSMGGWVALELSRRGRARSVTAFSPAGLWSDADHAGGRDRLRAIVRLTRATRALLPLTARFAAVRRFALRDNAVRGDRATPDVLIALADAVLGCEVAQDLLATSERLAPLEVTCPTQVLWSEHDRIFPPDAFGKTARERIPGARHGVLPGVGHVPMIDDPGLVASTILQHLERSTAQRSSASSAAATSGSGTGLLR